MKEKFGGEPRVAVIFDTDSMAAKDNLGRAGEQRAVDFLSRQGFEILSRNWRSSSGEIDIVAATSTTLNFVEVKTRTSRAFGDPLEAVGEHKQRRLRRLMGEWVQQNRELIRGRRIQLDIIAVLGIDPSTGDIDHLVDVQ